MGSLLFGVFGFLRSGEFTTSPGRPSPLEPSDIAVDSRSRPSYITVTLRQSKTDQFGVGTTIYIGKTGTNLCPVAAAPGLLFIREDGSPLSRSWLVRAVRENLTEAGLDAMGYSGHSFRIGAATAAAQAGLSDSVIQLLGRWKSSAFLSYIRIPSERLTTVSSEMADWAPPTNSHVST